MRNLKYRSAAFLLGAKLDPSAVERILRSRPQRPSEELEFVSKANVKLAVVQMELRPYRSLSELIEHLQSLIAQAQDYGAQLISFPEYVGLLPLMLSPSLMELVEDFFHAVQDEDYELCHELLDFFDKELSDMLFTCYYNIFALLAHQSKLYIHAGSTLLFSNGKCRERCFLFGPDGEAVLEQDKLFLSPEEMAAGITPGEDLELYETPLGRIAILPGNDSNFFEPAKAASQLGAQLILCPRSPSETDNDVAERCGPWMRCQEQALYALVSRFVGRLHSFRFIGKAAVFAPYEATKATKTGIVTQSAQNDKECVLCSRVNLEYLDLPVDLYAADSNPALSRKLAEAYRDFPEPLPHLEAVSEENNGE